MDFKEKFKFVNGRLYDLMAFREISGLDYVAISKKLMRAEDGIDLANVMDMMEIAVTDEQTRKNDKAIHAFEREREKKREERRRAK